MTPSCPPIPRLPVDPRSIIGNPGRYAHDPETLRAAWAELKAARGQPLARPHRLTPRHDIGPATARTTLAVALADACEATRAKVRAMIAEGRVAPTRPFGGDAA